ncbi:hypothetical protein ACFQH5_01870 [Halomonas salifodinae]|uniref:Uncharacterized protein n=1 Tax=Halomonas salifodinae TaxID=438745 RepID=A0ABW2EQW5_9GAMM
MPTGCAARALVEATEEAPLFLYPGDQHLFADSSLPAYDAEASAVLVIEAGELPPGVAPWTNAI